MMEEKEKKKKHLMSSSWHFEVLVLAPELLFIDANSNSN